MVDRNRMVFFNVAWMREYKGNWCIDVPVNGGSFIKENGWGGEVYNFQPYNDMMYGYVEPGVIEKNGPQRQINISRLVERPSRVRTSPYIPRVLVIWVATSINGRQPLVVGWYEDATLYRSAQIPPKESMRMLPNHDNPGEYFTSAREQDCVRIPPDERTQQIPGKGKGFGRSNIWYAQTDVGEITKDKVLRFVRRWKNSHSTSPRV